MANDTFEPHLQEIVKSLQGAGCEASLRGDGCAQFVFAEYRGRAIEVYKVGNSVYLEFFNEGDEQPSRDRQEPNFEIATRDALAWLKERNTSRV